MRACLAPGLWCHCSGEARAPGRHAADRLLPKEESMPVTGWRQHRKGSKWMLSLRGPGPTSLNPMRPDSENTEPNTWNPLQHRLTCSWSLCRSVTTWTSWVLEMEVMGFVSEGPLAWSSQFPWVIERSLLPVTKGFLTSLALSLEMGLSKSWKRISVIKCFHLQDTWACNSTQKC